MLASGPQYFTTDIFNKSSTVLLLVSSLYITGYVIFIDGMFITATVPYSAPASVLYFFPSSIAALFAFIKSSKFISSPVSFVSSKTTTNTLSCNFIVESPLFVPTSCCLTSICDSISSDLSNESLS